MRPWPRRAISVHSPSLHLSPPFLLLFISRALHVSSSSPPPPPRRRRRPSSPSSYSIIFSRRKRDSECFTDDGLNHIVNVTNCVCSEADYECDYGYERTITTYSSIRLLLFLFTSLLASFSLLPFPFSSSSLSSFCFFPCFLISFLFWIFVVLLSDLSFVEFSSLLHVRNKCVQEVDAFTLFNQTITESCAKNNSAPVYISSGPSLC